MIKNIKTRHQSGASLFEALMFIVVGALVIAGVIGMSTKTFSANDETNLVQQVTEFATTVKSTFAGQSNYTGSASSPTSLHAILNTGEAVPSGVSVDGTTYTNTFGGAINVDGMGGTYRIRYAGIPDASCMKVVAKANQGWNSITINANAPITTMPVPVVTAQSQCSAGSGGNTISWIGR